MADLRKAMRVLEAARVAIDTAIEEVTALAELDVPAGELLSVAQLSVMIDTHPETIRRWARQGKIPVADRGPFKQSRPRFRLADVLAALDGKGLPEPEPSSASGAAEL